MIQDLSGLNITDSQLNEYRENYVTALTGSKAALSTASEAMQLVIDAKTEDALRDIFNTYQTKGNRAYDDVLLQRMLKNRRSLSRSTNTALNRLNNTE